MPEGFSTIVAKSEDGSDVVVTVAERAAERRLTEIDVDPRYADHNAGRKDHIPFMKSGQPRVWVYRGYQGSLIPEARLMWFIKQGFTTAPTREAPSRDVVCGIYLTELGTTCPKRLQNELWRIHHIRQAHAELAAWVLTEADIARVKNTLGVSDATDSLKEQSRIAAMETKLEQVLAYLGKGEASKAVFEIELLKEELDSAQVDEEPFDDTFEAPEPLITNHIVTCKTKGRFGKYTTDCPACDTALAKKVNAVS